MRLKYLYLTDWRSRSRVNSSGISFNEGRFPSFCFSWRDTYGWHFHFYLAFTQWIKVFILVWRYKKMWLFIFRTGKLYLYDSSHKLKGYLVRK